MPEALAWSGFATGNRTAEQLLDAALSQAQKKAAGRPISAALIAFSPAQLPTPSAALERLALRLSCVQICAGSFPGILSDAGHCLGQPGCAVLLLSPPSGLGKRGVAELLWTMPRLLEDGELSSASADLGSVAVNNSWFWQYRKSVPFLRSTFLGPLQHRQFCSSGISPLTPLFPHYRQEGALLLQLERYSALPLLARHIPFALREFRRLPLDRLLIGEEDAKNGRRYLQIVATDVNRSGLWLERPLHPGAQIFLAWRNPEAARRDTRALLADADEPAFAWISSSVGRGDDFFAPAESDWFLWKEQFPRCPILGSYGQAEVSHGTEKARLTRFSTVFDLFYQQS